MSHQDWKPVTLGKKKKSVGTKRTVQKGIARPTNTSTFGTFLFFFRASTTGPTTHS